MNMCFCVCSYNMYMYVHINDMLTLKTPITTAADGILKYFFVSVHENVLLFHVSCLWQTKCLDLLSMKYIYNVVCYKICLVL